MLIHIFRNSLTCKSNSSIFNTPLKFTEPTFTAFIPSLANETVKSSFDCSTTPTFSENKILIKSFSLINLKSNVIPTDVEGKHNSSNEVIRPPDPIS